MFNSLTYSYMHVIVISGPPHHHMYQYFVRSSLYLVYAISLKIQKERQLWQRNLVWLLCFFSFFHIALWGSPHNTLVVAFSSIFQNRLCFAVHQIVSPYRASLLYRRRVSGAKYESQRERNCVPPLEGVLHSERFRKSLLCVRIFQKEQLTFL